MSEKIKVKLRLSFQRDSEDGNETEKFSVPGEVHIDGNKTRISYSRKEGEMTEDVTVTVHTDGRAEIDRIGGGYRSRLFIRNGKLIPANYMTPYGAMDISTKGNCAEFIFDGEKGSLKLSYDLFFSGQPYSVNNVTVNIKSEDNQ